MVYITSFTFNSSKGLTELLGERVGDTLINIEYKLKLRLGRFSCINNVKWTWGILSLKHHDSPENTYVLELTHLEHLCVGSSVDLIMRPRVEGQKRRRWLSWLSPSWKAIDNWFYKEFSIGEFEVRPDIWILLRPYQNPSLGIDSTSSIQLARGPNSQASTEHPTTTFNSQHDQVINLSISLFLF